MKKAILLLSHQPTPAQQEELNTRWGVERLVSLPPQLRQRWSQIPAEGEFPVEWISPIFEWLSVETQPYDLVWVQGEMGAVYYVVNWCLQHQRIPIYATTRRKYQSRVMPDGSVKNEHLFLHVNFRVYPIKNVNNDL